MRRREFIRLAGGAAFLLPLRVRAEQLDRIRRIAVLSLGAATGQTFLDQNMGVITDFLQQQGWREGQNIRIDYRNAAGDVARLQPLARELVSLKPNVILALTTPIVQAFQRETSTIPIVFAAVSDPVGSGLVASLAHPGGNITGFSNFEPSLAGKYVEILNEMIPGMTTFTMMSSSINLGRLIFWPLLEAAARHHHAEFVPAEVRDDQDIERVISSLGNKPAGLFVYGEPLMIARNDLIVSLTMSHRVASIASFQYFPRAGGLVSYGNDLLYQYQQAASYIDRILKGENASELPVQAPTKYEMVINLKTARAIGVTIPPTLLATANEVIE